MKRTLIRHSHSKLRRLALILCIFAVGTGAGLEAMAVWELPDSERSVPVTVPPEPVPFEIRVDPPDATLTVGSDRATGVFRGRALPGTTVQVVSTREGYESVSRTFQVTEGMSSVTLRLERSETEVRLQAEPADARITIDGSEVGVGSVAQAFYVGSELAVTVSRPGFRSRDVQLSVTAEPIDRLITLEPAPIVRRISLSANPLVRRIARSESVLIAADTDGRVTAVTTRGDRIWSRTTKNQLNWNSCPVATDSWVAFSGSSEVVVWDAASGSVVGTRPLDIDSAHWFGRNVVVKGETAYLPANSAIFRISAEAGEELPAIPLPETSLMTPAVGEGYVVTVSESGMLYLLDAESGAEVDTIPTSLFQPVGVSPVIRDYVAYVTDRLGTVCAVDLKEGRVLWETRPTDGEIHVEPVVTEDTVYVFSGEQVHALNRSDGSQRFAVRSATAAPLVTNERIYVGIAPTALGVFSPRDGRSLGSVDVGARITTSPADLGELFAVGTDGGEIVIVHPAGIVEEN